MRFDADKIDTHWYLRNCQTAVPGARGDGASSSRSSSSEWAMHLPVCNYTLGQLPIPALRPAAIPGLPEYLVALDAVFEEVQQQLKVQLVDRVKVMLGKL
jgi:hypothetical protein